MIFSSSLYMSYASKHRTEFIAKNRLHLSCTILRDIHPFLDFTITKGKRSPGEGLNRFDTYRKWIRPSAWLKHTVHHWRDGWRTDGAFDAAIAVPMSTLEPLAALPSYSCKLLLPSSLVLERGNNLQQTSNVATIEF